MNNIEETKRTKVYVAIPTVDTCVDTQSYALRCLEERYKPYVEMYYPPVCVRRKFHDFARNKITEDFLASDCDILWFLDSDITPPIEFFDLLVVHGEKWSVAGATYPIFMTPPGGDIEEVIYTTYLKNPNTGVMCLASTPFTGVQMVDGLATGCLMIRREVLEKLQAPYFEFKFSSKDRDLVEGEDLGFCRKVSELGYRFFVDFSMICRHQKTLDLFQVNNYAINYSNRQVLAYDASIKPQVEDAIKIAYSKGLQDGIKEASKNKIIHPSQAGLTSNEKLWNRYQSLK